MPWVSDAQRRWGNSEAGHEALGDAGVEEWNKASKEKRLPKRKKKMKLSHKEFKALYMDWTAYNEARKGLGKAIDRASTSARATRGNPDDANGTGGMARKTSNAALTSSRKANNDDPGMSTRKRIAAHEKAASLNEEAAKAHVTAGNKAKTEEGGGLHDNAWEDHKKVAKLHLEAAKSLKTGLQASEYRGVALDWSDAAREAARAAREASAKARSAHMDAQDKYMHVGERQQDASATRREVSGHEAIAMQHSRLSGISDDSGRAADHHSEAAESHRDAASSLRQRANGFSFDSRRAMNKAAKAHDDAAYAHEKAADALSKGVKASDDPGGDPHSRGKGPTDLSNELLADAERRTQQQQVGAMGDSAIYSNPLQGPGFFTPNTDKNVLQR